MLESSGYGLIGDTADYMGESKANQVFVGAVGGVKGASSCMAQAKAMQAQA